MINRVTSEAIRNRKNSRDRITALTAYDYPTAKILDESGIDLILVGDSLGMTVLGYPDTTHVTLEDMVYHTRAVARGISTTLLAADLPYRSYGSADQAVASAKRLVEAGANAVKLEGGQRYSQQIRAITDDGVPFIGHIGMLPQHVLEEGGYKIKGRTTQEREFLRQEALAVQEGGAFALVLELVESSVAAEITHLVSIPTIGIGSGTHCDGQILVFHDLVGYVRLWLHMFGSEPGKVTDKIVEDQNLTVAMRTRSNADCRDRDQMSDFCRHRGLDKFQHECKSSAFLNRKRLLSQKFPLLGGAPFYPVTAFFKNMLGKHSDVTNEGNS